MSKLKNIIENDKDFNKENEVEEFDFQSGYDSSDLYVGGMSVKDLVNEMNEQLTEVESKTSNLKNSMEELDKQAKELEKLSSKFKIQTYTGIGIMVLIVILIFLFYFLS